MPATTRRNWTAEEVILALELYCRLPFGKIHKYNPEIIDLAELIGRTPSAVALKLSNLASLDPLLRARNISGMRNGAKVDKIIFDQYSQNLEELAYEAYNIKKRLGADEISKTLINDVSGFPEGKEKERYVKSRIGQYYFRKSILASYNNTCCITGIDEPKLLIASHIKPWAQCDDASEKTNPSNGLCLNALHDRAFDQGLITIDKSYKVIISSKMSKMVMDENTRDWLKFYNNKKIQLPDKFLPDKKFIEYHNDLIFIP